MLRVKVGEHLDNALEKIKTKSPGLQAGFFYVKNLCFRKNNFCQHYSVVRVLYSFTHIFLCTSIRLNYV